MKRIFQKRATDFDPVHYLSSLESPPEVGGAVARGAGDSKGGGCRECPNHHPFKMKRFAEVWREDKNLFTSVMAIAKMAKDYGVSFEEAAGRLVAVYQDYSEEVDTLMEFLGVFYNVDPIMDDPGEDPPEPPEEYV